MYMPRSRRTRRVCVCAESLPAQDQSPILITITQQTSTYSVRLGTSHRAPRIFIVEECLERELYDTSTIQ